MFDGQFYPYQPIQFMDGLLSPPMGFGVAAKVLTRIARQSNTADASSYTFSVDFGAAAAGKVGIVAFQFSQRSITSVTADGVGCTSVVANITTAQARGAIYRFDASAGGTQSVVITLGGGGSNAMVIESFTLTGHPDGVPFHSASYGASGATAPNVALNIPSDGVAIGFIRSADNCTFTWTNLTEDTDAAVESRGYSGASSTGMSAETGRTITATHSSGTGDKCLVAASW